MGWIAGLPDIHLFTEFRGFARHVDALAVGGEFPAVVTAAQAVFFDPAPFERRAAMGTVKFQAAGGAGGVPEDDEVLAHDAHAFGQVRYFVRGTDGLPVAAQHLSHGRAAFDMGKRKVFIRDFVVIS